MNQRAWARRRQAGWAAVAAWLALPCAAGAQAMPPPPPGEPPDGGWMARALPYGLSELLLLGMLAVAVLGLAYALVRGLRRRTGKARASEIAAFLDYATKANEDVWEVNINTRERWRYRVEGGRVERRPIAPLKRELVAHYVHPEDLAMVLRHLRAVDTPEFIRSQGQERFECRLLTERGHRWMQLAFQGMLPTRGHPCSAMVFVMDIDDAVRAREQTSQALSDALAAAQEAAKAKGLFAAYVSHEIRSPLNAVLGYLSLARGSLDDRARLQECFEKSAFAANHLLELVNDVLDMGAIESGRLQLASATFDLARLLGGLEALYAAQAKARGLTYEVRGAAEGACRLVGDALRVKQVLVNLLSNALKFTPAGGHVTLEAQRLAPPQEVELVWVRFTVEDSGIGMTEAFQQRLFRPYTQQDAGIAAQYGGSGLGLSIVKGLVNRMGGRIAVRSAQGEGTTITVELPFGAAGACAAGEAAQGAGVSLAGKRVLVAEDNEMNLEIATELLRREGGLLVDGVADGYAALQAFMEHAQGYYAAILMDIRMPRMDGYAATRAIRASAREDAGQIAIYAMTADAFMDDAARAMEAGMNGHIAKPIDIGHVLATLREGIGG